MIRDLFYLGIVSLFLSSCTPKTVDKNDTAKNDSIKKYLDLASTDTLDSKLRNKYNDKAFSFIDLTENDTLTRFYLSSLSFNYLKAKNWTSYKKIAKSHYVKSINAKDTLNLARYYRYKAGYLKNTFVYDSSLYYYIKAEKFYKRTNDECSLAKVYFYKSNVQLYIDDYLGAELSSDLAYSYFKKRPKEVFTLEIIVLQGIIANNLKDYNYAIKKYKECIYNIEKYKLEGKDFNLKTNCLNNIGNAYREQKKFQQAIFNFKLVLKEKDLEKKDCRLYAICLNNLGYCYMQLNHNNELPILFFKAAKILDSIGDKNEHAISNLFVSQFYFKIKDTLKAQLYAEKTLKETKNLDAPYYYLTALSNAGVVNSKKAPRYIKEYHEKNDSLLFIERNARSQYYRIQLETDEIKQEKETAIKQKWIVGCVSVITMLIIILLLIITKQRAKQNELQLLQSQQKANEEIYDLMLVQKSKEEQARQSEKKRIALELHDGVMNKLACTRLNLDVLNYKKDEQTIEKCLTHLADIYQIEQEIRSISHDLTLNGFNTSNSFVALIDDFVLSQNNTYATHFKIEMDDSINWGTISSSIKMNLYRIIQEASHNINKFAQAKKAVISLILDDKNICLSITDDGKGFNTEINTEGIGLKNIKQRVETLNGKFVIQSINNKSTSLNIAIPFS